jgi:hypothetical protein
MKTEKGSMAMDENITSDPESRPTRASFTDTLKKYRLILFFIGMLLILAAIFESFGGFTSLQLYFLGQSAKPAGLVNYIEDHYQKEEDSKHLEQAVQIIIDKDMQPGMEYLYESIFSGKFNTSLNLSILRSLRDNPIKASAPSLNTLIEYYLNHSAELGEEASQIVKEWILLKPQAEVDAAFLERMLEQYKKENMDASLDLADLYNKNGFGSNEDIASFRQLLSEIKDNQQKLISLNADLEARQKDLTAQNDNISSMNKEAASLFNNVDAVYTGYLEKEAQYYEYANYQQLDFYVIGEYSDGRYEIAMPEYTGYGKMPSEEHAILITKETKFSSKGWAQLNVYNKGMTDVQLKEEYGSFTQQWTLYEEATDYEIGSLVQLEMEKKATLKAMQEENMKLNQVRTNMYQVCLNDILPIFDALTSIKSQVTVLEREFSAADEKISSLLSSYHMEYKSEKVNNASAVSIQDYVLESYNSRITYPQIYGLADTETEKKVNALLVPNGSLEELKAGPAEVTDYPNHMDSSYLDYGVPYNKNHLLSFVFTNSGYYTGAAHGFSGQYGMVIDTVKGTSMKIDDLFNPAVDWKPVINQKLVEKAQGLELLNEFNGMDELMEFYLTDTGICFAWDAYVYTAWAMGPLILEIPYSEVESILNPVYFNQSSI